MDLEKYLRDNYKTVEQLDGGGYYCEDSHHNALYIPADYDGDMKMLSYLPGDGGYPDGRMLRELIHGDNPPDYICCISHTAYHETAENLLTQTYDKLSSDLGMNINTVCQMGFSASGGNSFISMNNLLKEHPELTTYMVINNTSNDKHQVEQPENYQAIIENGTTIIYVDPPNNGYRDDRVITGLKGKYNMYILETRYDRRVGWEDFHCACNNDIQYNRMVDYLFGYTDEYGNWSPYLNCGVNYKLISYNPETKEQLEMNIEDLVSSALNGVRIPNLKKLLNVDNFTILDTLVKTDGMGVLGNLTDLKLNYRGGEVTSKYSYVETAMNNIRQQVKSSNYLSGYGKQTFRSSEGIPGCIGKYIDAYFSLVNDLLNDLSLQTESVLSYAQAMIDMDKHLAEGAEELGDVVEVPFEDGDKPQNDYKPPRGTPDIYQNPGNNNGYNPGNGNDQNPPELKELKFDFEDNRHAVLQINGNKIETFRYFYKYDTPEEASKAYESLLKEYQGKDYFDKMEIAGNGINVYIKKEYLESKSLDEIEEELLKGAVVSNG